MSFYILWWRTESNRRHQRLQRRALPTELLHHKLIQYVKDHILVRMKGVEPICPCERLDLNQVWLPLHHIRILSGFIYCLLQACFCFNLIKLLSSPCLILQQESLSSSVLPYMKCQLDLPFTSLYWVSGSNRPQMLERHPA